MIENGPIWPARPEVHGRSPAGPNAEIGDESWRHPSVPIAELSNQPEYEVRRAALPVEGEVRPVSIWYRHIYATDVIDVLAVTSRDRATATYTADLGIPRARRATMLRS